MFTLAPQMPASRAPPCALCPALTMPAASLRGGGGPGPLARPAVRSWRLDLAKPLRAELASVPIILATTWQVVMADEPAFAAKLRWWRRHRGISQLELAGRA